MEEAGLAMQTTTGHLSSMYTTVGNYRDVTVALIFFSRRRRRSSVRLQATRLGAFLSLCLSLCMVLLYIYIFFINTHRCKTHTRGRISTHVPVSCFFFFYVSLYLDVVWLHATRFLVLSLAKISLSKRVCGPTFLPCFLARFFSAPRSNEAFDRSTQQPIL